MRTTVNIHDGLLETVKQRARERGITLGDVIEDALQHYLAVVDSDAGRDVEEQSPMPVFARPGRVRPGVDLSTNAGLYEVMYADEDERARGLAAGE